ncbi:LTA synthase family protein [Jeotgalibacillus sp. ET6]|uniref:LTA synthase family protein n=1 Tax=Jeotgalibacillus sp. ET6 TaxID=3037260 RepID=UPI0024183115|nr:LTA synthase family protein [Jeotgalibacillus sp. ET6]MDG5470803.1 LTA synthase family protein [Jeotgalibacillus sp. ET6]
MNKKWSMPKLSLVIIAIAFLWIKTYVSYYAAFSIQIDNMMQAIILFINPLSFLLLIFGVALFIKKEKNRNIYVIATSTILTLILFANMVFYRFFNDFITLPVLFQTSNFGDLGGSALENVYWTDALYFVDILLLIAIVKMKPAFIGFRETTKINRRAYFLVAIATFFFNLGLAETERPQLLTRTFDREMLVKNIGTYNYHLYDIYLQSKQSAQRALADSSELVDVNNYVETKQTNSDDQFHGIAEGKNLIVVKLESTQNFVINNEMNGETITPFLNSLTEDQDTIYMDNFYHQTEQGKTSDSEFLLDNSLYPLGRGAVFFTHSGNEFHTLTDSLNNEGYFTSAMHANNKSFWNRDIVYENFGYDRYYSLPDYTVGEGQAVNWGMKDIPFFQQSVEHMKEIEQPFYAKMLTLTNHHPFYLDEEDKFIEEYDSNSGTLNRYFQTVRYTDEAIKEFFTSLKESGLYEDSIIVMYGDHYGISENHNAAMSQYLDKEITPFESTQLQRVPMFIHVPGSDIGSTDHSLAGQIDLKPTIQNLMGIESNNSIQFGQNIFSEENDDFVILRDGRFITEDLVYAGETCWDKETGEETDMEACAPFKERADEELAYNDEIIYGDLLRFYDAENGRLIEDDTLIEE